MSQVELVYHKFETSLNFKADIANECPTFEALLAVIKRNGFEVREPRHVLFATFGTEDYIVGDSYKKFLRLASDVEVV